MSIFEDTATAIIIISGKRELIKLTILLLNIVGCDDTSLNGKVISILRSFYFTLLNTIYVFNIPSFQDVCIFPDSSNRSKFTGNGFIFLKTTLNLSDAREAASAVIVLFTKLLSVRLTGVGVFKNLSINEVSTNDESIFVMTRRN